MKDFSASRAVESAEALVRAAHVPVRPGGPARLPTPPPLPRGVSFTNTPIEAMLHAPRWSMAVAVAAAPWWLRMLWRLVVAAVVFGAVLMFLTIVGLVSMLTLFWR